jgi:hypothetical protein
MLASRHALEDLWDGKDLSDEQIETKAQQACEGVEDTKSAYTKVYEKTRAILVSNASILSSMKFDYRMAGFNTAYRYIKEAVEAVARENEVHNSQLE